MMMIEVVKSFDNLSKLLLQVVCSYAHDKHMIRGFLSPEVPALTLYTFHLNFRSLHVFDFG